MFIVNAYNPTRVIFGPGRLAELADVPLPGKKALVCVTGDGLMEKLGIQGRVIELLEKNNVQSVVFDEILPNPTRDKVMQATKLAKESGCDFVVGLGGGSSVDTAKAVAIMLRNPGDLWEYASAGSGGRKPVTDAAPVVAISTTCGTGTETDPYCVITNEQTSEKLDFAVDAVFPAISFIDPELMLSLPRSLTLYQGFDALFHSAECYITNENENRLVDVYARDAISLISEWLPKAAANGKDIESRTYMCYAADIIGGYVQSIVPTTSHHIIAQTIGGLFPRVTHGLSLLFIAEAYYNKVKALRPALLDAMGELMGIRAIPTLPGEGFVTGLTRLMDETGMREFKMSEYGITRADLSRIAEMSVNNTGFNWERYTITKEDVLAILEESYA